MVRPRGPQNATGDAEIGQASDRYRSEIGQGWASESGGVLRFWTADAPPAAGGGEAFRIRRVDAWGAWPGWRRGARPEAGGSDRAAAGESARKALTAAARDGINLRRCNNGKEVIPCLTLRWRVAQVRRTRLRSRPPGSPDAAGNIKPSKPA
jgi:hypothetical protein